MESESHVPGISDTSATGVHAQWRLCEGSGRLFSSSCGMRAHRLICGDGCGLGSMSESLVSTLARGGASGTRTAWTSLI